MHKLLVIGLIALLAACTLSGDGDVVISTVQPGLRVDLSQPMDASSRFALDFTTTDEACGSSKLLADGLIEDDMVHVEISGLLIPSSCDVERELISKEIPMDVSIGTYDVRIDIGAELTNKGVLTYDGESFRLEIDEPHGLFIGHAEMNRIPENIVWGELISHINVEHIIDDFKSATSTITAPLDLRDGYYAHFVVDNGSGVNISANLNESNGYVHPFVFRINSGMQEMRDILNSFRSEYPDVIEISCTSWTGEQL